MFIKDKFWILWLKCYSFSQCGFAQVSSVQLLSPVRLFVTSWTAACQASLAITNRACSYSWPLSQWHHPTISSSVTPFSSCLQSLPTSGSFTVSQFFISGGQSIGASASASVLLMNIQAWFPLGLAGLISLQSKGLSRVFSSTTVWKHHFLGAQPFSQCISTYINIVLYDKNNVDVMCVTNTRHQQWKDNVKKKFTFTYICINSNSHIEEAAAALWLFYADSCHW